MRVGWPKWCVLLLTIGTLSLAGCGEDDPCATKTCEFGTCSSSSGQCVNVENCNVDSECVPGYLCEQDGTCVAQNTCETDGDCSAGVCEDGACVNPDQCTQDSDCLPRTYCGDGGTCRPDPCNNTQCRRGVCERGTDNCVSAPSCAERTETVDCIAGEKCVGGSCEPAETYCDNLTCERGVCSFAEDGCVNAMNCEGSDENCREGFFCNDMDACQPNLCVQNDRECGDNGVCLPSTGQCSSAEKCTSSADCVEGELCISQEGQSGEGVCTPEENACGNADGDGGCPGNQICEYTESELAATCAEPEVCQTSRDCKDGRQCGGRNCLAQVNCVSDDLEPNNTPDEATKFTDAAENLLLNGSLCQGDTDEFTFTTTDIVTPTTTGTIVVSINVPERDLGLGTVSATLTDSEGNMEDSASLSMMADDGTVRLTAPLNIPDHGTYSVSVEPGGQMSSAGLSYEMTVNVVPQGTVQACQDATVITPGQRLSGDIDDSAVSGVSATCMDEDATSSAAIYALQLEKSRDVTITAEPVTSEGDAVVSLRSRCLAKGSERGCSNANNQGASESISAVLGAGTHYVLVQSPGDASLGSFRLKVDSQFSTTCGPSDSYCVDASTSRVCQNDGGRFSEVSCDAGCNPSVGTCFPPAGDTCGDAPQITNESMSMMREIDLRQYNNSYSVSEGGCVDGEPRTGGQDAAYSVTIPSGTTMTASVTYPAGVEGALYIVDDCSDVQGTCQKGQQGDDDSPSQEEIFFINDTDSEVTKTLIVDTAAGQRVGPTQVNFSYGEIICTPGGGRCLMNGNAEICNAKGTAYSKIETCNTFPCQGGACPGDSCADPFNITQAARNSVTALTYGRYKWSDFADDYQGGGCGIDSSHTEGYDIVLQADLQAGETVDATVISDDGSPDADPSIYIQDTCAALSGSSCLAGQETNSKTATASYQASSAQTVYIFGDADDKDGSEEVSMEVNVGTASCSLGDSSCSGGDVAPCGSAGLPKAAYSCSGSGCSNGFCNNRTSEYCWDAENITSQLNSSGGFSRNIDFANFKNDIEADLCGGVDDFDNDGEDAVFVVNLQANEQLSATLDPNGSSEDATAYIIGSCADASGTCKSGDDPFSGSANVSYTAGNSAETVFLVADHDDCCTTPSTQFKLTGSIQ